jgi:ribosomal protein L21E
MSDIIEKYYIKYHFPNLERLYNYLKDDNISITKKQVKQFLETQTDKQITTQRKIFKSDNGHIIAFFKNELWQIDIFFLPKYHKKNKGYKYILAAIDIFTRFAYCIPLKFKDNDDVIDAIKKIFKLGGKPEKIISDSDSTFLSNEFQNLMMKNNVIHESVPVGDHNSLGVIDRFARTLKERLTALFLGLDNTNWIDYLNEIVDDYNNTKNRGILKIKPKDATLPYNNSLLVDYNKLKSNKNNIVSDLNIGDKVRIYIKKSFDKGTEPQFSNEVYTVKHIRGKTITLNNGERKKRNDLLLVPMNTETNKPNIIKMDKKAYKVETILKREDQKEENIINEKRIRKPNKKYMD